MKENKEFLKLTTVLFRTMQNVESVLRKDVQTYNLNPTEFGTLEHLYHKGKQPIQNVCDRMLMANSSMTYVVDKLEHRGFVMRQQDEKDKRNTIIDLTESGKIFFEGIFPSHVATLNHIYQALEPEEVTQLIHSLKKIGYQAMALNGGKK
jgi:MarR family 2-MHQ and catechol resistance regulon transcriptional repressor